MFQNTPVQQQTANALPPHGCLIVGARLSHFNCYKPAPNLNGALVYSVTLLIPKTSVIWHIESAINVAIERGIKEKWNGFRPMNLLTPLKDGDMYAAQKPQKRGMYVGNWFIRCNQDPEKGKPVILTEHRTISEDQLDVQSGDYANAVIEFIPFNNKSQGISAIPKVIHKTATGERFTSGITQEEALAAIGGIAPPEELAYTYQQPQHNSGQFTLNDITKLF